MLELRRLPALRVAFAVHGFSLQAAPPSTHVVDTHAFLSEPARTVLEDHLKHLSQTQKIRFYVVLLDHPPDSGADSACDDWQMDWVPEGWGGVFVYTRSDQKYYFAPSREALQKTGEERLLKVFREAVENPPLRESLDVVAATPVHRRAAVMSETQLTWAASQALKNEKRLSPGRPPPPVSVCSRPPAGCSFF